ncbi:MBL fold metallo-hydrolase [Pseudonocardia sp. NPDC049154]|uniref:MBL fold metallo-hydrolase n=1 Tax=Pseudonocardia sp. NPDC049154 TaxID=3155501 RepID=UPI0033F852AF
MGPQLRQVPPGSLVTHGHGDHFFGAGPLLDAFPGAALVAGDQQVVDEARTQITPQAMTLWNSWFAGQFPQSPTTPVLADSQELDLEGHPVLFRTIGTADGALTTIVHAPELHTICSGDIAYNNIHMWLWNSTPQSRQAWLASLDAVAALEPTTIIVGHKDPDAPDDNATRVLDQSRHHIEDFDHLAAKSATAPDLIDEMLTRYPTYGNRYTLFLAASTQFTD